MKKYFKCYLLMVILGFALCIAYYNNKDRASINNILEHVTEDAIIYSKKPGVYYKPLSVSLKLDKEFPVDAEIYYTTDGSSPIENGRKYEDEIKLDLKGEMKKHELKSVVYYRGEYSDIYKQEYVLCQRPNVEYGIDTIYITTDYNNLYNYETGIFVKGKTYKEQMEKYNGIEGRILYANYNMREDEWIRDAYMVMFDPEGNLIVNDNIGIGVSGGTSSALSVKSLKIYMDEKYGSEHDKFQINLREKDHSYLRNVTEYGSLRLRSGSQDMGRGNIRSAVVSALANDSNFDGCTESRRCMVYLNGSFYGIFDIQQNYSDGFLAKRFNLKDSDKIEKMKGSEYVSFEQTNLRGLFQADLNNEENRRKLESQIDMDNYLLYYAIEILCGNTDWPNNSFEMWRYTGQADENNCYTDGRWRFLIYDTDLTFPVEATPDYFEGCKEEQFDAVMQGRNRAGKNTFMNVMGSVYYRDKFITIISDLLNTSFSGKNVMKIMNMENRRIQSAREDFYDEVFVEQSELHLSQMRQYALERPFVIAACISGYFGFVDKYRMNLEISEGVEVYWNNEKFYAGEKYSCDYYYGVQMKLKQEAYPGYKFKYWLVNGKRVYDSELTITDEMAMSGFVNIKPILEKEKAPCLIISGVHSRGREDWIELMNVGTGDIDLSQYYLTDEADNLRQYQLPKTVLKENEAIIIHGSKNKEALGDYICNFSLSEYETLTLSKNGTLCDQVYIPKMDRLESYKRYDNSNQWVYYMGKDWRK